MGELKIARVRYAGSEQFIGETPSRHALVLGSSHDGSSPTPMELLLVALGACTGIDVITILKKKRQRLTAYEVEVRGERRDEHPRIYTGIEVIHRVRGRGVDPKAVRSAVELSAKKYCSVSAMLGGVASISTRYEVAEEE
jgi:putative redox protein